LMHKRAKRMSFGYPAGTSVTIPCRYAINVILQHPKLLRHSDFEVAKTKRGPYAEIMSESSALAGVPRLKRVLLDGMNIGSNPKNRGSVAKRLPNCMPKIGDFALHIGNKISGKGAYERYHN
jgi:hypothetical protein